MGPPGTRLDGAPGDLAPAGEPFLVVSGASEESVSDDGILVVSTRTRTGEHQLARVGFDGNVVARVGEAVGHADALTFSLW